MDFITEKQRDLLLEAFRELDKSSPIFPSPEEAVMNAAIMLSMPSVFSEGHECYGENGEKDELLARIIAYRYYSIADYLSDESNHDYILFRSFFTQISNTIAAIIRLTESGFDYQAISLNRNIVELFMMLIVIADSSELRKKVYSAKTVNSANDLWKQNFSKTKFIEMISPYSESFSHLVDSVDEWTRQIYKELSSFAHNDYANVLTYSLSEIDSTGEAHPNFWGKYITRKAEIYHRLVSTIAPLDLILCSILKDPKKDVSLFSLYKADKDYDSMMNYFSANTLRSICMILYSDISKREKIKDHVPVPLCKIQRSSTDETKPFFVDEHR